METASELIGSAEAAEILGMNRFTFIRKANSGLIPTAGKAPGKRGALVFFRSEIDALRRASESPA